MNGPTLKAAEAGGKTFLAKLGAADIKAARAMSAEAIQKAVGPGMGTGFWPVFDGDILPGDQYGLYQQGRFNDTPVLIGTNSDEGALFAGPGATAASFESQIRAGYGAKADVVLAAYPHETDTEASIAAKNIFRDSVFAWPTWTWATLQSEKGKGKAYVYYFDVRNPQSPNGASHGAEIGYVFGSLGGPGGGPAGLQGPLTAEDTAMSQLVSRYWVNFAKSSDPNGAGLPQWPAFSVNAQNAMFFDTKSSARPLPNRPQLQALDAYFAWRREEAKKSAQ